MSFKFIDPETCFTSDVIRDPKRFVGRSDLINSSIAALNSAQGLIAVYGKRGVGKSSLLRQIQALATGDYELVRRAGLSHVVPSTIRKYYTVYYTCDSIIENVHDLVARLCNDTHPEDGLLRLVPDSGKVLSEFAHTDEASAGFDLKIMQWGAKQQDASKYTSAIPGDPIQTFRNFTSSILESNNKLFSRRDSVLILLDEFDVIRDKSGIGSLIKSLSSDRVKFGICGIGKNINELVSDHKSVGRLIEQGAVHVRPMSLPETEQIFEVASLLSNRALRFDSGVVGNVAKLSEGYPYFAQLIGKSCVSEANANGTNNIDRKIYETVLANIKSGKAFPNLESQYQTAIGNSPQRATLLALLAEQSRDSSEYDASVGNVVLRESRPDALAFGVDYMDQLMPRLIEERYGPVLVRVYEQRGQYEFTDPVFRAYVKLRHIGQ